MVNKMEDIEEMDTMSITEIKNGFHDAALESREAEREESLANEARERKKRKTRDQEHRFGFEGVEINEENSKRNRE